MTALNLQPDDTPDTSGIEAITLLLSLANEELRRLQIAMEQHQADLAARLAALEEAAREEDPHELG